MQQNSQKYLKVHHKVTTWVAVVVIAGIAATLGIVVWNKAHESWLYEDAYTKYPTLRKQISSVVTAIETVSWRTYRDDGYGFQIRHPAKYQSAVGKVISYMVPSTNDYVSGTTVGPLIFVKAEDTAFQKRVEAGFEAYWNDTVHCARKTINNGLNIKAVFCTTGNNMTTHALIKGQTFDILVDGSGITNNPSSSATSVSEPEVLTMLSSFTFTK